MPSPAASRVTKPAASVTIVLSKLRLVTIKPSDTSVTRISLSAMVLDSIRRRRDRWRLCTRWLRRGALKPVCKMRFAKPGVFVWDESTLADLRAGIERVRVDDDLSRIIERGQPQPDKFIHSELFRASNFDDTVDRLSDSHLPDRACDIVGSHRLKQCIGQTHLLAVERNVGELFEKFEELGRMHDRVRNR